MNVSTRDGCDAKMIKQLVNADASRYAPPDTRIAP